MFENKSKNISIQKKMYVFTEKDSYLDILLVFSTTLGLTLLLISAIRFTHGEGFGIDPIIGLLFILIIGIAIPFAQLAMGLSSLLISTRMLRNKKLLASLFYFVIFAWTISVLGYFVWGATTPKFQEPPLLYRTLTR